MRYWMMRLFLTRRSDGTLFAHEPIRETRDSYLKRVFGGEIRFSHRKKAYVYKAFGSPDGIRLAGVIARPAKEMARRSRCSRFR
jgi:hypothetical protein